MSAAIRSAEEWRALMARRREEKAVEQERAKWCKADYKPGLLAPDSTTQYCKRYKREESAYAGRKRRQRLLEREGYHKRWKEADAAAKAQQAEARRRYARRVREAAAKPKLQEEQAALLVDASGELMTLEECAEVLKVSAVYAPRVLRLYGAEVQAEGSYLRGQVMRAAVVYRNEHPLIHGQRKHFYTYDEAAAYVGVHRDTLKHRARDEQWPKLYEWNDAVNQVCVYFRAAEVHHYKAEHEAWLNAGDSDHTHCLKMRQRRRNSPRKPKRR